MNIEELVDFQKNDAEIKKTANRILEESKKMAAIIEGLEVAFEPYAYIEEDVLSVIKQYAKDDTEIHEIEEMYYKKHIERLVSIYPKNKLLSVKEIFNTHGHYREPSYAFHRENVQRWFDQYNTTAISLDLQTIILKAGLFDCLVQVYNDQREGGSLESDLIFFVNNILNRIALAIPEISELSSISVASRKTACKIPSSHTILFKLNTLDDTLVLSDVYHKKIGALSKRQQEGVLLVLSVIVSFLEYVNNSTILSVCAHEVSYINNNYTHSAEEREIIIQALIKEGS